MMNLNDFKIVGNLTRDPEIRHTPKGTPVANVSLGLTKGTSRRREKAGNNFSRRTGFGPSAEL